MTTDKYNIDKIFEKSFSDMEESPPMYVWEDLKASLAKELIQKRRRRLWYAAASVVLLMAFGAGYMVSLNMNPVINYTETQKENQPGQNTVDQPLAGHTNIGVKETETNDIAANNIQQELSHVSVRKGSPEKDEPVEEVIMVRFRNKDIAVPLGVDRSDPINVKRLEAEPIKLLADAGNVTQTGKWTVGGNVSPLYSYRNITSGNDDLLSSTERGLSTFARSSEELTNEELPLLSYSGNISLGYQLSERISLQSGLGYSKIGQVSDNVYVYETVSYDDGSMSIVNSSAGLITADEKSEGFISELAGVSSEVVGVGTDGDFLYQNSSNLIQHFEYVEIPVMMKYKLVDRSIDFNLIAGLNAGFLIGNSAYIQIDDLKQKVGQTEDIRTINYNGTVGLGVDYDITESLQFTVEPIFKYSLLPIGKLDNIAHPYSLGLFTGCSYKF